MRTERFSLLCAVVAGGILAACADDQAVVRVQPGDSIQAAIDRAEPGTTIEVEPGEYHEALEIVKAGMVLKGIVRNGERPVLDGHGELENGILAFHGDIPIHVHETTEEEHAAHAPRRHEDEAGAGTASDARDDHPRITGIEISGFEIRNFTENGIYTSHIDRVVIRNVRAISNTEDLEKRFAYGIYPLEADVLIVEDSYVEGAWDAGYYLSVSEHVEARNNEAAYNTAGFEMENSVGAVVEDNYAHDNAGGVLIFLLPGLASKLSRDTVIRNNRIENNNGPNMGKAKAMVTNVPSGTGVMSLGGDEVVVTGNRIVNHQTFGVAIASFSTVFPGEPTEDIEGVPDGVQIRDNVFEGNGADPQGLVKELGLPGGDVLWDGSGKDHCESGNGALQYSLLPLPSC